MTPKKLDKIEKKRVQDALNKCFKHTLKYKGIIPDLSKCNLSD